MAEHETCPCAAVEQLKELVEKHDAKLEAHETRLAEGNTSFELIRRDIRDLTSSVNANTEAMRALSEKPSKRWDSLVDQAAKLVVTILLTYIAVKLGLQ